MRIAFYAPLKPVDHPVPSGERLMARQILSLLSHIGCDVRIASRLRSFSHVPSAEVLTELTQAALAEQARIIAECGGSDPVWRPNAWFTYHPYYKAPDLIGPAVATRLAIPYITAEASYAAKRDRDAWADWQRPLGEALRMAAVNIAMTDRDRQGIAAVPGRRGVLATLPPFLLDCPQSAAALAGRPRPVGRHTVRLVCVAMMRHGDKLESYRILADALSLLAERDWHLTIVGDGPARDEVERCFARIRPGRATWCGELKPEAVHERLEAADAYVWPGIGEAYGLAYLEAAAHALPAVALATAGVGAVVEHEVTGLLAADGGERGAAFAAELDRILVDHALRARLGAGAADLVRTRRSRATTAAILAGILERLPTPGVSHEPSA